MEFPSRADQLEQMLKDSIKPSKTDFKETSRVVGILSMYHMLPGEAAQQTDVRFSSPCESDQQMYERRLKIGEEWQKLDFGWMENDAGYVIVENKPKTPHMRMTEQEREEIRDHVLYLSFGNGVAQKALLVRPFRFFAGETAGLPIYAKSAVGVLQVSLRVYPK